MTSALRLHPDRFFPTDGGTATIARRLFAHVETLPIISPHGHTDPAWFATDAPFEETKRNARVNYLAYLYRDDPDFSVKIRQ